MMTMTPLVEEVVAVMPTLDGGTAGDGDGDVAGNAAGADSAQHQQEQHTGKRNMLSYKATTQTAPQRKEQPSRFHVHIVVLI